MKQKDFMRRTKLDKLRRQQQARHVHTMHACINLENALFNDSDDGFTVRVAPDVGEACSLIEAGFEYVTGNYDDGGKIFRKRK